MKKERWKVWSAGFTYAPLTKLVMVSLKSPDEGACWGMLMRILEVALDKVPNLMWSMGRVEVGRPIPWSRDTINTKAPLYYLRIVVEPADVKPNGTVHRTRYRDLRRVVSDTYCRQCNWLSAMTENDLPKENARA